MSGKPVVQPLPKKKSAWPAFWRDLAVTFIGTFAAFFLAVRWDISQRHAATQDEVQSATNIFYSQVQTNYDRLRRAGPVLRTEIRLLKEGNTDLPNDSSPLIELQETSDDLLVRMAPSVEDVDLMNRVLTCARESRVINSQIRWREIQRARRLESSREFLTLARTDSVLLAGTQVLMGVIEGPDTLYKRMRIPHLKLPVDNRP